MKDTSQNELFAAIAVGGLLGVFTSLLLTLPFAPSNMHNNHVQQEYGR